MKTKKKTYTKYLSELTADYANFHNLEYTYYDHKVIFDDVKDNFYIKTWEQIHSFPQIFQETNKYCNKYKDGDVVSFEMQKHDNELVLALNLILNLSKIKLQSIFFRSSQTFGLIIEEPKVNQYFKIDSKLKKEVIKIDIQLGSSIIIPILNYPKTAKFGTINRYLSIKGIDEIFDINSNVKEFSVSNFTIKFIDAIIVASQNNLTPHFILDARRPEMITHCYSVISFIKDKDLRLSCKVIFWQDLVKKCNYQLAEYIEKRYGICKEDTFI